VLEERLGIGAERFSELPQHRWPLGFFGSLDPPDMMHGKPV
jgi:hypothetical protein